MATISGAAVSGVADTDTDTDTLAANDDGVGETDGLAEAGSSGRSGGTRGESGSAARRGGGRSHESILSVVGQSIGGAITRVRDGVLGRPLASYHLIVTLAVLLTVIGLVMVLSASSVEGYAEDGSAYGKFTQQVVFAALGAILFYVALRLPVRFLRRFAGPAMTLATILLMLVLVPGIGTLSQGARRWFVVAGLSVQPSELAKLALCVWGAHLLASRRRLDASLKELLLPLLPVSALICLLIILEPNLSTTITVAIIVGALLWFAGLPLRVFVSFVIAAVIAAVILAMVAGYRSQRVMSFLGNVDDPQGAGYQARQARYALANGGFWGVGLGQSRAKWNYLPNAHNDFIFAIIGEELGLIGGLIVVALFGLLAYVGFRISRRSVDPFLQLMTSTITVLITAQALINIGYVVGLLPVTGIQLPLLSAGGTSTLTMLVMLGLLASAARHEPEAVVALTVGGEGRVGRLLRLSPPVPFAPSRVDALRRRLSQRDDQRAVPPTRSGDRRRTSPAARGRGSAWKPGDGAWNTAAVNVSAPHPSSWRAPRPGGSAGAPRSSARRSAPTRSNAPAPRSRGYRR